MTDTGAQIEPKKVFFSSHKNVKVAANLFLPGQPTKVALIFGHSGFGSKEGWSHLCLAVAHEGMAALALDFEGCGESEGYTSWIGRIKDFSYAIDFLSKEYGMERFAVGGHGGAGAYPAVCAAIDDNRVSVAILADCPFDFYEVHVAADSPEPGGNPACKLELAYNKAQASETPPPSSPVAEFRHVGEHLDEIYEEVDATAKRYSNPSETLRSAQESRHLAVLHLIAEDVVRTESPGTEPQTFTLPGPAKSPVRAQFHDRVLRVWPSGMFNRPEGRWKRWHSEIGDPKRTVVIPDVLMAFDSQGRELATKETLTWLKRYLVEQKWDYAERDSLSDPTK